MQETNEGIACRYPRRCFYKEVILIRKALAENRFNSCWEGAIVGGIARGGGTVVKASH